MTWSWLKWLVTPRGRIGRRATDFAKQSAAADFGLEVDLPGPRSETERTFDLALGRMLERELPPADVVIVEAAVLESDTPTPWWARVPWFWVLGGALAGLAIRAAGCGL